jgi:phosphatidylethanolamine-binding protein (PEBP) family uncharacterized protein
VPPPGSLPSVRPIASLSRYLGWLLAVALLLATACARDGRDLAEAQDWQTTTTRPPPPTSAPNSEVGTTGVGLTSPEFAPGDLAPIDATCGGANRAPALSWTDLPVNIGELAVGLIDQTDPENPVLLWLIVGIEPSSSGIAAGEIPGDSVETLNDYGQPGYGNPCLETANDGLRDLQFRLYLMETPTGIQSGAAGNESWDIVVASASDSASLLMRIEASV